MVRSSLHTFSINCSRCSPDTVSNHIVIFHFCPYFKSMFNPDHFTSMEQNVTRSCTTRKAQVRYFFHKIEPRSWIFFLCNSREHHISSCWETINQGDWSSLKGFFKSHTDMGVKAFVAGPGESPGITGEPFASPGIKNRSEQEEVLGCVYKAPWFELTC